MSLSIFLYSTLSSSHHSLKCSPHDVPGTTLSPTHDEFLSLLKSLPVLYLLLETRCTWHPSLSPLTPPLSLQPPQLLPFQRQPRSSAHVSVLEKPEKFLKHLLLHQLPFEFHPISLRPCPTHFLKKGDVLSQPLLLGRLLMLDLPSQGRPKSSKSTSFPEYSF